MAKARVAFRTADTMITAPAHRVGHTVVLTASPVTAADIGTTVEKLKELR